MLVLYAIIAEQNIARLFAAALLPGFLAAALYCGAIALLDVMASRTRSSRAAHRMARAPGPLLAGVYRYWPSS